MFLITFVGMWKMCLFFYYESEGEKKIKNTINTTIFNHKYFASKINYTNNLFKM